jgi:plasmid stability protein
MADLNIRNIDVTLVTRLKSQAALAHQTLRAYCIAILSGSGVEGHAQPCRDDSPSAVVASGLQQVSIPVVPTITITNTICHECNAMGGMHQRWCSKR